jgi:hypothetical protein
MKKTEMIKFLEAVPGDPEIFILDLVKNASAADADGTSDGVYPVADVEHFEGVKLPENSKPFIAIEFEPKTI